MVETEKLTAEQDIVFCAGCWKEIEVSDYGMNVMLSVLTTPINIFCNNCTRR